MISLPPSSRPSPPCWRRSNCLSGPYRSILPCLACFWPACCSHRRGRLLPPFCTCCWGLWAFPYSPAFRAGPPYCWAIRAAILWAICLWRSQRRSRSTALAGCPLLRREWHWALRSATPSAPRGIWRSRAQAFRSHLAGAYCRFFCPMRAREHWPMP